MGAMLTTCGFVPPVGKIAGAVVGQLGCAAKASAGKEQNQATITLKVTTTENGEAEDKLGMRTDSHSG